mgnify:CR=1 FL=1|jgi:hypothetical protein
MMFLLARLQRQVLRGGAWRWNKSVVMCVYIAG